MDVDLWRSGLQQIEKERKRHACSTSSGEFRNGDGRRARREHRILFEKLDARARREHANDGWERRGYASDAVDHATTNCAQRVDTRARDGVEPSDGTGGRGNSMQARRRALLTGDAP
jgi:hypothetical protein